MSRLDAYLPPAPPADPVLPDPDIDPALLPPAEPAPGFAVLNQVFCPIRLTLLPPVLGTSA